MAEGDAMKPPALKLTLALAAAAAMGIAALTSLGRGQAGPVARGQAIYGQYCASCHGANLEGQANWRIPNADGTLPAPPHDASGHSWHHDDAMLFEYTKFGGQQAMESRGITDFKSAMPAFEGVLSDGEINDVWAFIKSTWSDRERNAQAERTAAAQEGAS